MFCAIHQPLVSHWISSVDSPKNAIPPGVIYGNPHITSYVIIDDQQKSKADNCQIWKNQSIDHLKVQNSLTPIINHSQYYHSHSQASITPWGNINPFSTNVPLLYFLKTSENRGGGVSDVFRGYRSGTLLENRLKSIALITFTYLSYIDNKNLQGRKMPKNILIQRIPFLRFLVKHNVV